jgi:hypothetical protein
MSSLPPGTGASVTTRCPPGPAHQAAQAAGRPAPRRKVLGRRPGRPGRLRLPAVAGRALAARAAHLRDGILLRQPPPASHTAPGHRLQCLWLHPRPHPARRQPRPAELMEPPRSGPGHRLRTDHRRLGARHRPRHRDHPRPRPRLKAELPRPRSPKASPGRSKASCPGSRRRTWRTGHRRTGMTPAGLPYGRPIHDRTAGPFVTIPRENRSVNAHNSAYARSAGPRRCRCRGHRSGCSARLVALAG